MGHTGREGLLAATARPHRASAPSWVEGAGPAALAVGASSVSALGGSPAIHRTVRSLPRPPSLERVPGKRCSPRETTPTGRPAVLTPLDAFMQRVGGLQRRRRTVAEIGIASPQPGSHIRSLRRSLHRSDSIAISRRPSLSRLAPLECAMTSPGSPTDSQCSEESPCIAASQTSLPLLLRRKQPGQQRKCLNSQSEGALKVVRRPFQDECRVQTTSSIGSSTKEKTLKRAWPTSPISPVGPVTPSPRPDETPSTQTDTPSVDVQEAQPDAGAQREPAGFALGTSLVEDGGPSIDEILARQRAGSEGFSTGELARMRQAFRRFKPMDYSDVSQYELGDILVHLGYVGITEAAIEKIASEVLHYSTLDFEDFTEFAERFAGQEQAEVRSVFTREASSASSGCVSKTRLQSLMHTLGVTAVRSAIEEALRAVGLEEEEELNPLQFARFLAAWTASEGFCEDEIQLARKLFTEDARNRSGFLELRPSQLGNTLIRFLGAQAAKRPPLFSPTTIWNEEPGIRFHEFLVWARRSREDILSRQHKQFTDADLDGDGFMSVPELERSLHMLGMTLLPAAIEEILEDTKCPERLDFDAFVCFVTATRESSGFTRSEIPEFREVFTRFDYDSSGEIDQMELLDMLRHLGHLTSLEDVHRLIKAVDTNGNGLLDFPEFLRLMRLHRERELTLMHRAFDANAHHTSGRLPSSRLQSALRALGWADTYRGTPVPPGREELEEPSLKFNGDLSFEEFFAVAVQCRKAFARRRCRHAGFSAEEVQRLAELFWLHGSAEAGTICKGGLARLLTHLGVPMATAGDRADVFKAVEASRCAAEEAGEGTGPDLNFWGLLHLLRALGCRAERATHAREMKALEQINFSPSDVSEFRHIFNHHHHASQARGGQGNHDLGLAAEDREPEAPPQPGGSPLSALRAALAGDRPRISWQSVLHLLRSLGLKLRPRERTELVARAADFAVAGSSGGAQEGAVMLDFAAFLLLVRWMLDSNFDDINGIAARVAGGSLLPMQAALASAVATTTMPQRELDLESQANKRFARGIAARR